MLQARARYKNDIHDNWTPWLALIETSQTENAFQLHVEPLTPQSENSISVIRYGKLSIKSCHGSSMGGTIDCKDIEIDLRGDTEDEIDFIHKIIEFHGSPELPTNKLGNKEASFDVKKTGADCSKNRTPSATSVHKSQTLRNEETLLLEIDSLIGLNNIKKEIKDLVNLLKIQKMRTERGLPSINASNHMVFFGNPGTGKTTIARKLGEIYRELEILSSGHMIETDRSGLVGGYLGHTAIKTMQVLESAKGGILFIDEAYTLSRASDQDFFGQEAIDTILKYMEDNRSEIVIIVAGYEAEMQRFIQSNPGLKSRFNKYLHFPDYSAKELGDIFLDLCKKNGYLAMPDFEQKLRLICEEVAQRKGVNFSNGRAMRNLFEISAKNQANRLANTSAPSKEDLMQMHQEDIRREDALSIAV